MDSLDSTSFDTGGSTVNPSSDPGFSSDATSPSTQASWDQAVADAQPNQNTAEAPATTDTANMPTNGAAQNSWFDSVGSFVKGAGEGVWDGAKGMAEGMGNLAESTWNVATDSGARQRAWESAQHGASAIGGLVTGAVADPGKAASQLGDAVGGAYDRFQAARQQAEASGHGAEFWGKLAGRGAFEVGTAIVPAGLAAKGLEGAGMLGRAGEAGELLGGTARGAATMAEGTEAATATARAGEGTALAEDTAARGGVQTGSQVAEASGTTGADATKVYRVEGEGNHRVSIGDDGSVEIPEVRTNKGQGPERNLYLNFGDEARAREFLQQRLAGGYPDNVIKSFDVPSSFVDELRTSAVPEAKRGLHPTNPVIADPTKAADQFGLPGNWTQRLRDTAIQGSGQVHP